jgi:hypothetical protein
MTSPHTEQTEFRLALFYLPLVFLSAAYLVAAQIFGLWPLRLPAAAVCPATATNNQIFVDPTGSNRHTENWQPEAHSFAQTLGSCARATFWTIDDNSSSAAAYGKPLVFPMVDPSAPGAIRITVEKQIEALRAEVEQRIAKMMLQKGAARSDVIGIFNKLSPEVDRRNVLVVFSDGKESGGGVDLEDGHSCIDTGNVSGLVDLALRNRHMDSTVDRFDAIKWVIPASSGNLGCNSRDELWLFWGTVVARLSRPGRAPALLFDTNVFSLGAEYEPH